MSGQKGSGINKKISAQISEWRSKGHQVFALFIMNTEQLPPELSSTDAEVIVQRSLVSKYFKDRRLEIALKKSVPDLVYIRMGSLPVFSVSRIFDCKVVLEINTRVFEELKVSYKGAKYLLLRFHFKHLLSKASGYVGVTEECLYGLPKKPSIQVGNSICLDPQLYESVVRGREYSNICIFVGSEGCPWHGVDRLVEIARNNSDFSFWIVGYKKEVVESVLDGYLPDNVVTHGYLTGNDYRDVLKKASLAFGSLAMDRNGMRFSSSLKNRDYLQYGLPIIMQGIDSDLEGLDSVVCLPIAFSPEDVRRALEGISLQKSIDNIDSFSKIYKSIASDQIEARRLKFFESIVL